MITRTRGPMPGYEIPGFRIVSSDKAEVDVVPDLTMEYSIWRGKGKKKITQPCWRICNQKSFCRRPRAIHKANIIVNAADSKQRPKSLTGKPIRSEFPTNVVIFLSTTYNIYMVRYTYVLAPVWYSRAAVSVADLRHTMTFPITFQYPVEEAKVQNPKFKKIKIKINQKMETPNRIN